MVFEKKKNLALVLSGGSARGLAHIGVLEVLEENHIPIDAIVGTSMGAIIGGVYAAGKFNDFKKEILKMSSSKMKSAIFSLKLKRPNSDSEKIAGPILGKYLKDKKIEDLGICFTAVATDLRTGKEVHISKGSLLKAIYASMSIPGIFHPFKLGNRILVDGGVVAPLPETYGHVIARKVIAVNAMPNKMYGDKENFLSVLNDATTIMSNTLMNMQRLISLNSVRKRANSIFIQLDTEKRNPFDFYKIDELIKIGRDAANKHLKQIIALSKR